MSKGIFVDFNLTYQKNHTGPGLTAVEQADAILKKAAELITNGARGVAIIYSANYGQTRHIEQVYFAGGWDTQTGGANQAEVMSEMEALLGNTYATLQGKMHIAPITTMTDGSVDPWNADVHMGIVTTDLDRVQGYLEGGWDILGWQNQDTVGNANHPYPIGGGVTKTNPIPQAVSDKIQNTLIGYAKQYSSSKS